MMPQWRRINISLWPVCEKRASEKKAAIEMWQQIDATCWAQRGVCVMQTRQRAKSRLPLCPWCYLWYLHTTIAPTFKFRDETAMICGSIKWKITINQGNIISLQLSFNLHWFDAMPPGSIPHIRCAPSCVALSIPPRKPHHPPIRLTPLLLPDAPNDKLIIY